MIKKESGHIPVLDSIRAVAALSVCLYHFVCGPIGFFPNENVLHFFTFGAYGVQLFFVISGFIIPWSLYAKSYKIKHYGHFLLKRFLRLEPPYIVSIIVALVVIFLKNQSSQSDVQITASQVFLHIGYFIPFSDYKWISDVYWTLAIEFQFYLFMGLFYFLLVNKRVFLRILAYLVVLSLAFVGSDRFVLYWLPVFLLGNVLFLFITKQIGKIEFGILLALIFTQIAFLMPVPVFFSSLIPVAAILFMFNFSNPILDWLGKISYSIYLIHAIIGTPTINVLSHYAHNYFTKVLVLLFGVALSICFSYFLFKYVEKPSKKLSSKINF